MKSKMSDTHARRRQSLLALAGIVLVFLFGAGARAATFTVTTAADNGDNSNPTPGSLREAVNKANANTGTDTIAFNIPGAGVQTIKLASSLLSITDPVVIDGYTQPGSSPNTLTDGDNAVLLIEIDGTNAGKNIFGLPIIGGGSTVRGLILNNFGGNSSAILLFGKGGNLITGNFIGTNANGTTKAANYRGIDLRGSDGNTIGGTTPAARNLISGNSQYGVVIGSSANNLVQGNLIGTDASGTAALSNFYGVSVITYQTPSSNNLIGGTVAGSRNLISGNVVGIQIDGNVTGTLVQGNLIGTDVTGKLALGNYFGISLTSSSNQSATIGGASAAARNIISGSKYDGISLNDTSSGVVIQGNYIGTDITGTAALSNNLGINSTASNLVIGGTSTGEGNIISGNVGSGIFLTNATGSQIQGNFIGCSINQTALGNGGAGIVLKNSSNNRIGQQGSKGNIIAFNGSVGIGIIFGGTGNAISSNQISSNSVLGIDLAGEGATSNDQGDADTGANNLQNYPVITSATTSGTVTVIQGTLNSAPHMTFHLEFFASSQPSPSGYGEGETLIGSSDIPTDGNGNANFNLGFSTIPTGKYISATATDPEGNTSEFSLCAKLDYNAPLPSLSISDLSVLELDSNNKNADVTVTLDSPYALPVTVKYATADGTATTPSDYFSSSGTLNFAPGQTTQTISIPVKGDKQVEPDETLFVNLSGPVNASLSKSKGTITILDDDAPPVGMVSFSASSYSVNEGDHFKEITVTRTGDASQPASVDYATSDGSANQHGDYTIALGTLHFAPAETSKTLTLLITDDSYAEGDETFNLTLSNPIGVTLGAQPVAQVTIIDNNSKQNAQNAIDDVQNFVRQHYHDFLNREPDPTGFQGWQDTLNNCAQGDTKCDRVEVSSGFYRSQEFHDRGYFIYRFYSAALGRVPKYEEFMRDLQKVSGFLSDQQQEDAKVEFIREFTQRSEFKQKYGQIADPEAYVDMLLSTAGVSLQQRDQLVAQLLSNQITREQALRAIVESTEVDQKFFNESFVIMQYFSYLRRDADILYLNWLATLNQTNDYRLLVNGFVNSLEYRLRFGQ